MDNDRHEIRDLKVAEVSFVGSPANDREIAIFKSADHDPEDTDMDQVDAEPTRTTYLPAWADVAPDRGTSTGGESAHEKWTRRAEAMVRKAEGPLTLAAAKDIIAKHDPELRERVRAEPTPQPETPEPEPNEALDKIKAHARKLSRQYPDRYSTPEAAFGDALEDLRREHGDAIVEKARGGK